MVVSSNASLPDFRQLPKESRLRRVQSEAGHELRVTPPLIRIRTERLSISAGDHDYDDCDRPRPAVPQQSPLRRALPLLSLSAQFVNLALAPDTQPRRELSIVFERRSHSHRSRVTLSADARVVNVLACLALLSTVTAMTHLAGSSFGRAPIAPRRANIAPAGGNVARCAAPPSIASQPLFGTVLAGRAEPLPAFIEELALADVALRAGLPTPLAPVVLAHARSAKTLSGQRREGRDAFAAARRALLQLHAHLRATVALTPAHTPVVAWPGGHGRARRLSLTRQVRRLSFELRPLAEGLGCSRLLASLSEASCAVLLPEAYRSVHDWHQANDSASARALAAAKAQLDALLAGALPTGAFCVSARAKSRLSVFDKAVLRGRAVGDLLALRIVLADDVDCAAVHSLLAQLAWTEDTTRFKN